jgi:saccharopine dehydrogenase-like NADP-dependent oxidoreductase
VAEIAVLGAGMVGAAIAMDLGRTGHAVTVADRSEAALADVARKWGLATVQADLSSADAIRRVIAEADLVMGALPSVLGLAAARTVLGEGKRYVDISFLAEDPRVLDPNARKSGAVAVYDCGVAPGLSNLLAGDAARRLSPCDRIDILVGGLPIARHWPFEYKAPFAPSDVLEEYVRPARFVVGGKQVVREALSEPELVDFPGVGTLEVFNTDGLRSLLDLPVPDLRERTMRYPGHIELMRVLRTIGLLGTDGIEVGGHSVVPRAVLANLLFPLWTFEEGEPDVTVLRVVAEGRSGASPVRWTWDLVDRYDPDTGLRSMSRTTAFPATIVAGLLLEGRFDTPGIHAPEVLARQDGVVDAVLAGLADRGVHVTFREDPM